MRSDVRPRAEAIAEQEALVTWCRLHLWTPEGASCVHTPLPNLLSRHVTWRPDGMAAAVSDVDRFCIAYVA